MRLQEPDYQSATGYEEWDYPEEVLRVFLNRIRQGTAWRTRPNLMQQMVNDLDQDLTRCREEGEAQRVGIEIKVSPAVAFIPPVPLTEALHTCPECARQFKMKAHLGNHLKSHGLVPA